MADHERVKRITFSLTELFPGRKDEFEKEKWYFEHQYTTFAEWEQAINKILDSIAYPDFV